ncbi:MAG: hypothetical protein DLM52_02720 [Chthoniobacterales bacterium]|nr:MAG: hypothetical protein DLM52_02720 [Chthoniobacterales bacterium]
MATKTVRIKKRRIGFRAPMELVNAIDKGAKALRVSRAAFVRLAIQEKLPALEKAAAKMPRNRRVTLRMPRALKTAVDAKARKLGISKSQLFQRALARQFRRKEPSR